MLSLAARLRGVRLSPALARRVGGLPPTDAVRRCSSLPAASPSAAAADEARGDLGGGDGSGHRRRGPEPEREKAPVFDWRTGDPLTGRNEYEPRPSYSRAARRARLNQALDAAREGDEFEVPTPAPTEMPGPCGAVMNVLRETGPIKVADLYRTVEERYPGAVKSRTHMKRSILMGALVNKVMMVRPDEHSRFKDHWAVRKRGQVRMALARNDAGRMPGQYGTIKQKRAKAKVAEARGAERRAAERAATREQQAAARNAARPLPGRAPGDGPKTQPSARPGPGAGRGDVPF